MKVFKTLKGFHLRKIMRWEKVEIMCLITLVKYVKKWTILNFVS